MPVSTKLQLTEQERSALERVRDHDPKAYMRERAAALLKIAEGYSATQVALGGLLRKRRVHTVCEWVTRYKDQGLEGLALRSGRGRKPSFSPSVTLSPLRSASPPPTDPL